MDQSKIFVSYPLAQTQTRRAEILAAIEHVVDSETYVLGTEVAQFEKALSDQVGVKHAVGVANGTDALALALRGVGIKANDPVITTPMTALATVAAILQVGGRPILADIDDFGSLDLNAVEAILRQNKAALLPVHLYGAPVDLDGFVQLSQRYQVPLIEDCAQAQGAKWRDRPIGSFGVVSTFSFYPTKNLGAIGDGGAVLTNDDELAEKLKQLRQYGWDHQRVANIVGVNSRLDELQAAILNVKLKYFANDMEKRREIAKIYDVELAQTPLQPVAVRKNGTSAYHLYVTQIEPNLRSDFIAHLKKQQIFAGIHYAVAVHHNPGYLPHLTLPAGGLPKADQWANSVVSLPIYPELTENEIARVIAAAKSFFGTLS